MLPTIKTAQGISVKSMTLACLAGVLTLASASVFANPPLEEKYKENFSAELQPLIKQRLLTGKERNLKPEKLEALALAQAQEIANCQYQSIQYYPAKFRNLSIGYIASGLSSKEANRKVTEQMLMAIDSGELPKIDFQAFMEKAISTFKECAN